jgi:hypothetical protein
LEEVDMGTGTHYERGEKEAVTESKLVVALKPDVRVFDAVVYGFPVGKAEIRMSTTEGKMILQPLLKAMLEWKEIAPGTGRKGLWDVHLYGCTDQVQGSPEYDDRRLRLQRAAALKSYLAKLLPASSRQPAIFAKEMLQSQLTYLTPGQSRLERAQNRAVGVIFARPALPTGCYEDGVMPTISDTASIIRRALSLPIAKTRLGEDACRFWDRFLALVARRGNDEYLSWDAIQNAVTRWSAQYKVKYALIERLVPKARDELARLYRMGPFPSVRSDQIRWTSTLTNAVLAKEKPELFLMRSSSLLSRVREIVRSKCGDSDLVLISLKALLAEFQTGRSAVHQYRNFQCAIAAVVGGESALQNFIERGARDWMTAKEGQADTVYSLYVEVWPTKKFPFWY